MPGGEVEVVMKGSLSRGIASFWTVSLILTVVSGCRSQTGNADVDSPRSVGTITPIMDMRSQRAAHTATRLHNGRVLIVGGFVANERRLTSTEIFDPETKTFTTVADMSKARASHSATLLPNGKVLIAGGFDGDYLNTAEIFDPETNRFTSAGRLVTARSDHVATPLNDGKVLLAGGVGPGWTFLSSAEIYDPRTNSFTQTGTMTTERESHTATLLKDGRVLLTGGHKGRRANIMIYSSVEIFDPKTRRFSAHGNLTVKRHKHDAVLLENGRVLVVGGSDERDGGGAYRNAEIFDPDKATSTSIGTEMNSARYKLQGTTILLTNGKVLIAGGASRAEIFDPRTNRFERAAGDMGAKKLFATATLLNDGQVLIAGGYTDGPSVSANAWLYRT